MEMSLGVGGVKPGQLIARLAEHVERCAAKVVGGLLEVRAGGRRGGQGSRWRHSCREWIRITQLSEQVSEWGARQSVVLIVDLLPPAGEEFIRKLVLARSIST
jgi:hypothetical protein